jgi:hypothetical protein
MFKDNFERFHNMCYITGMVSFVSYEEKIDIM